MKTTLENMNDDAVGKSLLGQLKLDGFGHYTDALYSDIRAMANKIQRIDAKFNQIPDR